MFARTAAMRFRRYNWGRPARVDEASHIQPDLGEVVIRTNNKLLIVDLKLFKEFSRASDSGRRVQEFKAAPRVARVAEPALVNADGQTTGEGGEGGDSGDGGDDGGGDGDGEDDSANSPPHLLLLSAALCVAMLLLLANQSLSEWLKSLVDPHGMAGGFVRFLFALRYRETRNWKLELALLVLGGGAVARHVPQEVFAGGQEWWLFTAGLCWREVYDIIKRKIKNIIEAVFF